MDATVAVPPSTAEGTLHPQQLVPVPPAEPRSMSPPGKMAMVTLLPLNSFAVAVNWTQPADLFSRRSRSALALARGKQISGNLTKETCPDLPVAGYRLQYWAIVSQEDTAKLQTSDDILSALNNITGVAPQLLEESWGPDASQAVLKWLAPGTTYVFQVAAFNSAGNGTWSEPSQPFSMPERADGLDVIEPTAEVAEPCVESPKTSGRPAYLSKNPHAIEIEWSRPCDRGADIHSYDFIVSQDPTFSDGKGRQLRVDGKTTRLNVDGLVPNQVYYLKHRAINDKGSSDWSEATKGIATRSKPPDKPLPPVRYGAPSTWKRAEVVIKWETPEFYNIPVTHYRVRSSTTPDMSNPVEISVGTQPPKRNGFHPTGEFQEPDASKQADAPTSPSRRFNRGGYALTQMKVNGLRPASTYYFQVQASNQIGDSEWSDPSAPMSTSQCPPGRCAKPMYIFGSKSGGMRIYWPEPETYADQVITGYDVRVSQHAMMKEARKVTDVVTRKADVKCLPGEKLVETTMGGCWEPGKDHFYQVRAVSSDGKGEWSESSDAMQVIPERPLKQDPPHKFICLPRAIIVHWRESDCQGSPILGYELRYSTAKDMSCSSSVPGVNGIKLEMAVTNLQPLRTYYFEVRCCNRVGWSDWSDASRAVAVLQAPPTKMGAPFEVKRETTSLTVGFVAPADVGTLDGDMVQSYALRYACGPNGVKILEKEEDAPEVLYFRGARAVGTRIKNLVPGSLLAVQVFALNEFGESPISDISQFLTLASRPDAPNPPVLQLQEVTSWSVTVGVLPNYDGGSKIKQFCFEVEDSIDATTWRTPVWDSHPPDEHGMHYYCINHLSPGKSYRLRAFVVNNEGSSDFSEWSEGMNTMATVPKAPAVVPICEDPDCRNFTARWETPEDNGAEVTEYVLQWSIDETFSSSKAVKEAVLKVTQHRCTDCLPGMMHYARVSAVNSEGRGPWGPVGSIMVSSDIPLRCARPRIVAYGITHLRISWMPPHDSGSPITYFWIRYWETDEGGRPENERDCGELLVVGKKRFANVEHLQSRRSYNFEVAAENEIGIGPWSDLSKSGWTLPPQEPSAPSGAMAVRSTANSITVEWNASESIGTECTAQTVQLSVDPHFPPALTGTAWLPPYKVPMREAVDAELVFRSSEVEKTGPSQRAGYKAFVAAENEILGKNGRPLSSTMSTTYGSIAPSSRPLTATTWDGSPRKQRRDPFSSDLHGSLSLEDTTEDAEAEEEADWDTTTFNTFFNAQAASWQYIGLLHTSIAQRMAIEGKNSHCEGSLSPYERLRIEASREQSTKEYLEEKRNKAARVEDTDEGAGAGGLMKQLTRKREIGKKVRKVNMYTLIGVKPGTYYYIRIASVNEMGIGEWSQVSAPIPSGMDVPESIPVDIQVLRTGCTSLTFGWQRPFCWGAPVTHYMIRFAETEEGLWKDDCKEFRLEETEVESWDSMIHAKPSPPAVEKPDLKDLELIGMFANYLFTRFGSIETSWDWLDVNGNGDVSRSEFFEGDYDTGPPFADFPKPECLETVWQLLDDDGGGNISINEYNKLIPYFEAVSAGSAAIEYDGVYFMVPSLVPGTSYYIMAKACNMQGASEWTKCLHHPIITEPSTPARMAEIESVVERRTVSSVVLRWRLPWGNGDCVRKVEVKWLNQDVADGNISYEDVQLKGHHVWFEEDSATGEMQQELEIPNLLPGQLVMAVARAYNRKGGAREWSPMPGPRSDVVEDLFKCDFCTMCAPPDMPSIVRFDEEKSRSVNCSSTSEIYFEVGERFNGRDVTRFELELLDDSLDLRRSFAYDVTKEESDTLRKGSKLVRRPIQDLKPGESYCLKVRVVNAIGPSAWTEPGPFSRMPPDVPDEPPALLSELTSLEFIELKWHPPECNGSMILKYEVRMALSEYAPDNEWTWIDEAELKKGTRTHGSDGRRTLKRDQETLVFRQKGLKDGTAYYFTHRAINSVGHSVWSEVSRFMTKTSKPVRLTEFWMQSASSRDLTLAWKPPFSNGVPLTRYDIVGGPNERVLRWCQMASMLIDATADADRLFGFSVKEEAIFGKALGNENFAELYCDECMYTPVLPPDLTFCLKGLIPGQDYFFIARGVAETGKGEFSEILGPLSTLPEEPKTAEEVQIYSVSDIDCSAFFTLPYNMGSPITELQVVLKRIQGPVADNELHPETGEVLDHIAGQQIVASPSELIGFNSLGNEVPIGRHQGMTAALRRNFVAEGLQPNDAWNSGRLATKDICTGQAYRASFEDLRPGSEYEIFWSCKNSVGRGPVSSPVRLKTLAAIPDKPVDILITSGL
eukprot:TRINITY_DN3388_c0_g3_i1.p1 TRINITY_DN3388_c0_g3~~TRINITY_DN3388_c0_g3_i1.p1  ORF type:complete len:2312 (-),score=361.26 TRINITY_DN3388_c0_g3_i1:366-7250(-)